MCVILLNSYYENAQVYVCFFVYNRDIVMPKRLIKIMYLKTNNNFFLRFHKSQNNYLHTSRPTNKEVANYESAALPKFQL